MLCTSGASWAEIWRRNGFTFVSNSVLPHTCASASRGATLLQGDGLMGMLYIRDHSILLEAEDHRGWVAHAHLRHFLVSADRKTNLSLYKGPKLTFACSDTAANCADIHCVAGCRAAISCCTSSLLPKLWYAPCTRAGQSSSHLYPQQQPHPAA